MNRWTKALDAILAQHTAVLGKTGSGKTHTAKVIVEEAVRRNARVCILDPIKSDWWGMISSADGHKAGLPFRILGGPRGHVPLHPLSGKAVAEVVANGKLPLTIIDMANFDAGEPQRFFIDFAKALIPRMKGVLYLVLEEAHEFAPKERAGFGAENMAIHYAKKLATAGRSKGIRLIAATQRVQSLHNAVLGSCETMIAHRITAPADQDPVKKWLKANVPDKETEQEIASTMAQLTTGTAWVCSGEAQIFERIEFPAIKTFDNSATPTDDVADIDVKTAQIDTKELKDILGEAVTEAEATDPVLLQRENNRLRAELAAKNAAPSAPVIEEQLFIAEAERVGFNQGANAVLAAAKPHLDALKAKLAAAAGFIREAGAALDVETDIDTTLAAAVLKLERPAALPYDWKPSTTRESVEATRRIVNGAGTGEKMKKAERSILTVLAQFPHGRTKQQLAILAGYSVKGGGFNNALGWLRSRQYIAGSESNIQSTPEGIKALGSYQPLPRGHALLEHWLRQLKKAEREVLSAVVKVYPRHINKEALASHAGYEPTGGGFNNALGKLRTLELIYGGKDAIRASDALFS